MSLVSGLLLIWGHLRIPELRKYPGMIIFWQVVSQAVFDFHWYSGVPSVQQYSPDRFLVAAGLCQGLGAFFAAFYCISWNYIVAISYEIYYRLKHPYIVKLGSRTILYHIAAQLIAIVVFCVLMFADNNNGQSTMGTCFFESGSDYELLMFVPLVLHCPLVIYFGVVSAYYLWGKPHLQLFWVHVRVCIAFFLSSVLIIALHGLNYGPFEINLPSWMLAVRSRQSAATLGTASGFLVFVARVYGLGLMLPLLRSLCPSQPASSEPLIPDPDFSGGFGQLFVRWKWLSMDATLTILSFVIENRDSELVYCW